MCERIDLVCPEQTEPIRLDAFLAASIDGYTRANVQKWIEEGMVSVGGKPVMKSRKLTGGEKISVLIPPPVEIDLQPQDLHLDIVYEDEHLLVVNKPKGMVVHPAPGNPDGTLVNGLLYHCRGSLSGINGELRPGIVHRIDKNTSGLLIVAKTNEAHVGLAEQIKVHSFMREYEGVVYGAPPEEGTVDAPIGRSTQDRKKMCVTEKNSKNAVTHYTLLRRFKNFSYMRFRLETGRTHQIRVHMAYIGHPLAGDDVYGPKKIITELEGQCLHARRIGFIHPITGEYLSFESELPLYFTDFLDKLGRQEASHFG